MNVHTAHCCITHGCKYGDPDCPVANDIEKQDYPCEECVDDFVYHPCPCCNGTGQTRDEVPGDGMVDI